ncbi:hypothetical protein [Rheinheimera sp. SA_1]|uniref:hypothetical protein n=1 Tax=Rheinheimera sp. SA_1 TaxID=1827365 RepID=UPI0009EF17C7|nr:hypothetical protein [Rheinheimera sp. SA_1]
MPVSGQKPDGWSGEAKLAVVIKTAPLSEAEFSQYCRVKGLWVEKVKEWRSDCVMGTMSETQRKVAEKNRSEKIKSLLSN